MHVIMVLNIHLSKLQLHIYLFKFGDTIKILYKCDYNPVELE